MPEVVIQPATNPPRIVVETPFMCNIIVYYSAWLKKISETRPIFHNNQKYYD